MKDELLPIVVETGDNTNYLLYVGLLALACGAGIFLYNSKKKSKDKDDEK